MRRKIINNTLFISVLAILALNCTRSKNILFTDTAVMPNATWSLSDNPDFRININDSTIRTNVFFNIRTGSKYPFRNIWLFVTAISPNGKISVTDTLQYDLADEKGRWYGKGFGDIHEMKLPYRQNVFFPAKGTYHFKIQHGMRTGDLKGVYDIGIRIEKTGR
ncbi:MAG: gliding motility lipoprotein GldH [Bacteroidales bacterium]